jgi:RimJ/RimL family protein N-acetyltransferase
VTHDGRNAVEVPGVLRTERLLLRGWTDADLAPFSAMSADPHVMEFMPNLMSRPQSDAWVAERVVSHFDSYGYGSWAVERQDTGAFIGFVGLMWQTFKSAFTPALEVGWRLDYSQWGHGFATEAARKSLAVAFDVLHEPEVVSMTVPQNARSRSVMRAIGMSHDARDDFDHPRLADGHRLQRHVLYRITAEQWSSTPGGSKP